MDASGLSLASLDDAALARRIVEAEEPTLAGDEEAELCRRYARRVLHFGLRRLRDEDRARDLVQDVLVITIQKLRAGEVREPERIGSFILGVARMLTHSSYRAEQRPESIDAAHSERLIELTARDPLAEERVAHCLRELKDRERAVILLTYYAEESTREIAGSLGLSDNHVRVMRHRGIRDLRSCLGLDQRGAAA